MKSIVAAGETIVLNIPQIKVFEWLIGIPQRNLRLTDEERQAWIKSKQIGGT